MTARNVLTTSSNARAVPRIRRAQPPNPATPWVSATHPTSATQYKFRLELHRKGGAIHVQFHKDSANEPGKSYIIRNQRSGFAEWIEAARTLIRMSVWDRNAVAGPHMWRVSWRAGSVDYPNRMALATLVVNGLDVIINPRMGTSIAVRMAEAGAAVSEGRGGVRTGYAQARANRRNELLRCVLDMRNVLHPMAEKCSDTRSMVGYTGAEKLRLMQVLASVQVALTDVHDLVFNNKLDAGGAMPTAGTAYTNPMPTETRLSNSERTHRRTPRVSIGDDDTPISFDDMMGMGAAKPERRTPVLTAEDRANWIANFPDLPIPGDTP